MRTLYFTTVMISALSMAMAFSHLLQMPVRLEMSPDDWLITQQLFPYYASLGAFVEIGAISLAGVSAWFLRSSKPAFELTLTATVCLATGFAVWLAAVAPANAEIIRWLDAQLPQSWESWRMRWEYGHAARASLLLAALGLLVFVLADSADLEVGSKRVS